MFHIGDLFVYGNSGVCEIQNITTLDINKDEPERLYYILKPLYQSYTVSTPLDNDQVLMRPIISRDEAERLIRSIPEIQAEAYYNESINQLSEHYKSIISTFDGEELIRMTMSIYSKNQLRVDKKLKPGAIDQRYMKRAEELIFGEFAAALGIPKEDVPEYIAANIKEAAEGN
jgi:CarD family transcriptional regulator